MSKTEEGGKVMKEVKEKASEVGIKSNKKKQKKAVLQCT